MQHHKHMPSVLHHHSEMGGGKGDLLENMPLSLNIQQRELNFPIYSPRSDQRWIQQFDSVSGHDDFDVSAWIKSIELIEVLEHRLLEFPFTTQG